MRQLYLTLKGLTVEIHFENFNKEEKAKEQFKLVQCGSYEEKKK